MEEEKDRISMKNTLLVLELIGVFVWLGVGACGGAAGRHTFAGVFY